MARGQERRDIGDDHALFVEKAKIGVQPSFETGRQNGAAGNDGRQANRQCAGGQRRAQLVHRGVERVLELVKKGFYDGLRFHRVEDYLIQTGRGDIEIEPIEGEMFGQDLKHEVGMVGMARLPDDYDSATTQFYICKKRLPRLNGEYTLIGKVVEGMELVFKIKKGDKIKSIDIVE